jgi:hypothetical protein
VLLVLLFIAGHVIRLYLCPRAERERVRDFVSHAFTVHLVSKKSEGYYNSHDNGPYINSAAQVLENCHFSKHIAADMAKNARIIICAYSVILFVSILNRTTSLSLIAIIAQAFLGEYILSRWLRIEWLKARFESLYDTLYTVIQNSTRDNTNFIARIFSLIIEYESTKSIGGIVLSEASYLKLNQILSDEWNNIKGILNIN